MTIIDELIAIAYDYAETHTDRENYSLEEDASYYNALRIRAMGYAFGRTRCANEAKNSEAYNAWSKAFWRIHNENKNFSCISENPL